MIKDDNKNWIYLYFDGGSEYIDEKRWVFLSSLVYNILSKQHLLQFTWDLNVSEHIVEAVKYGYNKVDLSCLQRRNDLIELTFLNYYNDPNFIKKCETYFVEMGIEDSDKPSDIIVASIVENILLDDIYSYIFSERDYDALIIFDADLFINQHIINSFLEEQDSNVYIISELCKSVEYAKKRYKDFDEIVFVDDYTDNFIFMK